MFGRLKPTVGCNANGRRRRWHSEAHQLLDTTVENVVAGNFGPRLSLYRIFVAQWDSGLRHCDTRREDAGSVPFGVIGFFFDKTLWPLFTPGKDPVPFVQEAGWAPGPVWTGAENLAPTGIRSPDRPARSQSLYRLRYLAHLHHKLICFYNRDEKCLQRGTDWVFN